MIPPAIIIVFHFSRSYCVLNCGNVCRQRIGTKRNVQGCRENWLKWRSYSKNATIFFMFFNHIMVRRSACLTLGAQVFYSIKMSLYQLYNHYIIITLETWKIKYISFIHYVFKQLKAIDGNKMRHLGINEERFFVMSMGIYKAFLTSSLANICL